MRSKVTVLMLFLTTALLTNSETLSGFYVDDGFGQTVPHKVLHDEQKQTMKQELLDLFELPERPRRIPRRAMLVRRSAPKFLLKVYKHLFSYAEAEFPKYSYINTDEFYLSEQYVSVIYQSDFIMTFGAHNPHAGNASKANRGKRLWFDVSEVPREERIIAAEVWLYQSREYTGAIHEYEKYIVTVYRVEKSLNGGRVKHFVASADVTLGREGWIAINVTRALEYWVTHPRENRGLFLGVHRRDFRTGRLIRPDDIGVVGIYGVPEKQPFMVGFFAHVISKKPVKSMNIKQESLKIRTADGNYFDSAYRSRQKPEPCRRRSLYVNFKDLEWQDWILEPQGYNAFYCSGDCNFPLNTLMNATNHAIVQSFVHLKEPQKIPKPCCTPTKLSPISVLYYLDDSNVVLKKYQNMVVNSCGCQ